jgi:hypothetical protein
LNNQTEIVKQIDELREKLNRSLRRTEGLRQKSKILESQYVDAREREQRSGELVMELLERQKELNVMLNRANIMLNRAHETMALTSVEFNEMAKALPEPKKAEWSDRVAKINDLFKKTGIQDGEVLGLESSNPPSLATDEMKKESEEAFGGKESIWSNDSRREPPRVEAELLEENHPAVEPDHPEPLAREPEIRVLNSNEAEDAESDEENPDGKRRAWWPWGGKSESA